MVTWVLLITDINIAHNALTIVKGELMRETFKLPDLPGCSLSPRIDVLWSALDNPELQIVVLLKTSSISDFVNIP